MSQMGPCGIEDVSNSSTFVKYDELPDQYDLGTASSANRWVFTDLKAPRAYEFKYEPAGEGRYAKHFPDATGVLREPWGKEIYFQFLRGEWYKVGHADLIEGSIDPEIALYSVPLPACPVTNSSRVNLRQTNYQGKVLPVTESIQDIRDATGVLYLPDNIYDAIRIKRERIVKRGGQSTRTLSYVFIDELTKEFLMEVEIINSSQIKKVTYRASNKDNVPLKLAG